MRLGVVVLLGEERVVAVLRQPGVFGVLVQVDERAVGIIGAVPRHHAVGPLERLIRRGAVIARIGVGDARGHAQRTRQFGRKVDAGRRAVEVGIDERSVLAVMIEADIVIGLARAAGYRSVVILHDARAEDGVHPVEILSEQRFGTLRLKKHLGHVALLRIVELLRIHHLQAALQHRLHAGRELEIDRRLLPLLRRLGRDDDDAARTLRTVDGRRSGILEHGERLHVVGVERTADDAVHHVERVAGCGDGARAADTDRSLRTGLPRSIIDQHAGGLALEHVPDVGRGDVGELLRVERNHGARKLRLALRRITHHDHLVEAVRLRLELHVDRRLVAVGHLPVLESHEREDEHFARDGFQRIATVRTGRCPPRRALDDDRRTREGRFVLCREHRTLNGGLRMGAPRQEEESRQLSSEE